MPKLFSSRAVEIASEYHHDLRWSLRPIFCWMQLLGVDVDVGLPRSKLRRYGFIFFSVLMVVFTESVCVTLILYVKKNEPSKTVALWCRFLKRQTRQISTIIFQLTIFFMGYCKWKRLWEKAEAVQPLFTAGALAKLRKISIILLIVAVLFVSWWVIMRLLVHPHVQIGFYLFLGTDSTVSW